MLLTMQFLHTVLYSTLHSIEIESIGFGNIQSNIHDKTFFYFPIKNSRFWDLREAVPINQDCSVGHNTDRIPRLRSHVMRVQSKSSSAQPGKSIHGKVQGSRTGKPFHQLKGPNQGPSRCGSSGQQQQHH